MCRTALFLSVQEHSIAYFTCTETAKLFRFLLSGHHKYTEVNVLWQLNVRKGLNITKLENLLSLEMYQILFSTWDFGDRNSHTENCAEHTDIPLPLLVSLLNVWLTLRDVVDNLLGEPTQLFSSKYQHNSITFISQDNQALYLSIIDYYCRLISVNMGQVVWLLGSMVSCCIAHKNINIAGHQTSINVFVCHSKILCIYQEFQ
jgi:hypothetical protein